MLRRDCFLFLLSVLCLCHAFMTSPTQAEQYLRPSIAMSEEELKLWEWTIDQVVRVPARFAWIDYEALRRDFPKMRDWSDIKINQFMARHVFVLGKQQLKLVNIRSTEIPLSPDQTDLPTVYRQPEGGRSGMIMLKDGAEVLGYVDMKGMGYGQAWGDAVDFYVEEFQKLKAEERNKFYDSDHSDGLMTLGEGVAELTRQRALQQSFDLHNVKQNDRNLQTVDSYFLIDLPFDILRSEGQRVPAGVYGRQGQFARATSYEILGNSLGIYADDYGKKQHDGLGAAIDMGGVLILQQQLRSSFYNGELDAKPDEKTGEVRYDAQQTKPWSYGHQVAVALRAGDKDVIVRHLEKDMLGPITADWQKINTKARELALTGAIPHALHAFQKGFINWGENKNYSEQHKLSIINHITSSLPPDEALKVVGQLSLVDADSTAMGRRAKELIVPLTEKAGRCKTKKAGVCTAMCAVTSP